MSSQKINEHLEFFEILNRVNCTSIITATSRVRGPLTEAILEQSLRMTQQRHPCLNYRIKGSLDNLKLETEGVANIPLHVISGFHSDHWQDIVLEEVNKKIDSSQALLRTILFHPENDTDISYLITTSHHGITDALSCFQLHRDILTFCHKIVSGKPIEIESFPDLPSSIEELLPESVKGFRGQLKRLLYILRFGLKQLRYRPQTLKFEKCVSPELRHSRFFYRQINEALAQDFVNACKREGVSMTNAVCAAMMLSVAKEMKSDMSKPLSMSCWHSINMRKCLEQPVSRERIGIQSSGILSYHTLRDSTLFWNLAREVKQQFQDGLMDGNHISQWLMISKALAKKVMRNPKETEMTILVSNACVKVPENFGDFLLEDIKMTIGAAGYGTTLSLGMINFGKKLDLNFFYAEPSISEETVESLANGVIYYLSEACKHTLEPVLL
ncbi:MAG: alcohol acetyltransferase [Cyanobacteria bacterium P01_F01_bin.116]